CSASPRASPSMVVTCLPAAAESGITQDATACPSSSTQHAPHCPSPQPYLVPVRSSSWRRQSSSVRSASTFSTRGRPLTVTRISSRISFTSTEKRSPCGRERLERIDDNLRSPAGRALQKPLPCLRALFTTESVRQYQQVALHQAQRVRI